MEKIKTEAFVIARKGKSNIAFEKQTIELPVLKSNDILIQVEAFGLNFADVMARLGLYREAPPFPCVVGYEVVGIIEAVGENVSKDNIGKRVVAFTRFGGYARKCITNDKAFCVIDEMPVPEALALCTQGVTAYYMTHYLAPIQKKERALVHAAAGGVGTLLTQLIRLRGGIVYAKVGQSEKARVVKELGVSEVIDYGKAPYEEQLKTLLGKNLLSVVYNPVGGDTFKKDMKLLGPCGRLFLYGGAQLTQGRWGILSVLNFLRKMGKPLPIGLMIQSKSVLGVNMLRVADYYPEVIQQCLTEVIELGKTNQIKTISGGVYPSSQLIQAHDLLESGKSTGKICIVWDKEV
jgi:NADPH:quinone reductase-like Zn-dependent oxidoreductase